jgi:hypothetical protein
MRMESGPDSALTRTVRSWGHPRNWARDPAGLLASRHAAQFCFDAPVGTRVPAALRQREPKHVLAFADPSMSAMGKCRVMSAMG